MSSAFFLYSVYPFVSSIPASVLTIVFPIQTPQLPAFTYCVFFFFSESNCGDSATQYMNKDMKGTGTGPVLWQLFFVCILWQSYQRRVMMYKSKAERQSTSFHGSFSLVTVPKFFFSPNLIGSLHCFGARVFIRFHV